MLVLSRFAGQEITIGDDITICVTEIKGGKVWIGITAPSDVAVHRREIYDRIKQGIPMTKPRVPKGENQKRMKRWKP